MTEQERCPECGYPQPEYNRDPYFDCVCTGDSNCDGRALRRAKSELAALRKAIAAAEELASKVRALKADDNSWTKETEMYDALPAFDAAMAELRKGYG